MASANQETQTQGRLGVFDAVSIIVGIVIGVSIFRIPDDIFSNSSDPWMGLAVWAVCGILALIGALCYAELATNYPRSGGDYYYLTRAFGPWLGFLFGWARLAVIFTSNICMMAIVFGESATRVLNFNLIANLPDIDHRLGDVGLTSEFAYAAAAVVILTLLNMVGVTLGKTAQDILSLAKIVGLGAILIAGLYLHQSLPTHWELAKAPHSLGWTSFAMILVLYAYGGWNDAGYVAAEVRNPGRNIPRALIYGVALIMIVYLLVNAAYLMGLGFDECRKGNLPTRLLDKAFGYGSNAMNVIIMISALGAANGLIFTGARCYASLGNDYALLSWMGHWTPGKRSPVLALLAQTIITLAFLFLFSTWQGHHWINDLLTNFTAQPPELPRPMMDASVVGLMASPEQGPLLAMTTHLAVKPAWGPADAFDKLLSHTAPVFWGFFLLTGVALMRLRYKDAGRVRTFSVPLFPVLPLIFCGTCAFMLWASVDYVRARSLIAVGLSLLGLPLYWLASLFGGYRGDAMKKD